MANKNAQGESYGKGRTRSFTAIVYPDSAPENWLTILSDLFIPAFISPLHEFDTNEIDNTPKKPHYHIVLMFDSVKTEEQAKEVFDMIGGVVPPSKTFKVQSLRGISRYLCHLDNPEKYQYDTSDVRSLCGADYYSVINLVSDRYVTLSEILDFCDDNNVAFYSDLIRWCKTNRFDWFRALCDGGSYMVKEYLKTSTYADGLRYISERKNDE